MKFLTYKWNEKEVLGVIALENKVLPLDQIGIHFKNMTDLIKNHSSDIKNTIQTALERKNITLLPLDTLTLLAPIPNPAQDIICLGINYAEHAEESARYKKESFERNREYPVYFSKRVTEAVAPEMPIHSHSDLVENLDYEAEFAFIIGKDAKNVSPEHVKDYIFGYTILNDISAREIQTRHRQWYFGKSLDGFTPLGPWIVTTDEIPYPPKQKIQSFVNGELRQNSNTSLLLFDLEHILCELSRGMTLKAGTIISTGTPAGVGMGFKPPKFLKSGDIVTCRIEGIGELTNPVQ